MREPRDVAMLKESAKNNDVNGSGGLRDIKEEVKEEVKGRSARSTPDTKPPSNKMANGEADTPKSEDNNKNKLKTEGIKEENGGPMSVGSDMKKSPAGAGTVGSGPQSGPSGPMPESMPGFIQQQSRIFVFSTEMANKAAQSVKLGQFKSMIAFHMEHPTTKQYLQKNPMKPGQYGRPPTSMPMYSQFPGNAGMMVKPGMGPSPGGDFMVGMGPDGPCGPSVGGSVEQWVQQQNANLQEQQAMRGMPSYPMNPGSMGPGGPGPGPGPGPRPMGWSPQGMMQGPQGPMGGPGGGYPMMDSSFEFNPDAVGPGGSVSMPHMNLSQNKVPNENLTPEQLERREEQLANLRKLGQMLFAGEQNPMEGGPRGMYMGGNMGPQQQQMMSPQQQAMMSQHQAMMGGPGPHPGMMSPTQQFMMQQQQQSMGMGGPGPFPPGHPGGPRMPGPGMPPSSMNQDINSAQQAWMQMQQEFYEKKSHQMMQRSQQAMMGGMGPGPQHPMERGPMNGPPPPYYSTMSGKRQPGPMGMVGSPTSPNPMMDPGDPLGMFPAPRSRTGMPMDPQGMDGMGPGFGPGPSPGPGPGPGMPPHSMGGMGMGMPAMDQMIPGMGPGPGGPQGPMPPGRTGPGGMMGSTSGVNVVSSTSGRKNSGQVTLHRAGNPEKFTPDPNSANLNNPGSKPPPSYAQAQKRKREDLEDAYKHLQPTPSPTQLNYLNQFEGHELTITKQLNSAFRDPTPGGGSGGVTPHDPASVPPSSHQHNTQFSSPASNSNPVNSPLTHGSNAGGNPPSVKGPMSNSSQTSSTGHLGSPGSLHHGPGPSPMSGANMRLTHFDPPPSGNGSANSGGNGAAGMSSAPATPTTAKPPAGMPTSSSSSMSNITSASLANLAKGVEHLSNQMQQNMMQGGPFHSIQVQGQMSGSGSNSNSSNGGSSNNVTSANNASSQPPIPVTCQSASSQPVNNTYLSTNLQIGQVNIQNVTAGSNASMQVQQMTAESPHMSMAGGTGSMMGSSVMTSSSTANGGMGAGGMPPHMGQHMQQHQQQAMMMGGGPGGMQGASMGMSQSQHMQSSSMPPNSGPMATMAPGMPPTGQVKSPPYSSTHQPVPHPIPHPNMSTGMHQSQMGGAGNRLASPPFPPSSVGNANVQIQPKAPNTIQYLPANPPPTQQPPQPGMTMGGGPPPAKRPAPDMDFMPRYSSPMDMKNSSTLQYFPGSPNHGMRHPNSSVGPSGPMSEFSPQQTMEMQQAMMMRGGGPPGPNPQDYGPMGPMGQGMHPGMTMGPGGPVPPSAMQSPPMGMDGGMRGMEMGGSMPGMGSPMDPMMMGPSPSAMRQMSALGPGGPGSMDPMSPMSSMMGPGGGPPSGPYPGGAPSGYIPNGQSMMMGQGMQGPGPAGPPGHPGTMGGMPMSHGMPRMPGGPPSMRMPMQGGPGPGPGSSGYSAQYQQFQQQLYSQGRSRQMSPMHMMGGGPPGPGQPYMGMMPNMPPS